MIKILEENVNEWYKFFSRTSPNTNKKISLRDLVPMFFQNVVEYLWFTNEHGDAKGKI